MLALLAALRTWREALSWRSWLKVVRGQGGVWLPRSRRARQPRALRPLLRRSHLQLEPLEVRQMMSITLLSTGAVTYANLPSAVSATSVGDELYIDDNGPYDGGVLISQDLSIQAIGGATPAIVASTSMSALFEVDSGAEVSFSGLILSGSGYAVNYGIYATDSSAISINDCVIDAIHDSGTGVGVFVGDHSALLVGNVDPVTIGDFDGAGIVVDDHSGASINHVTITGGTSSNYGILVDNTSTASVGDSEIQNIFSSSTTGAGIYVGNGSTLTSWQTHVHAVTALGKGSAIRVGYQPWSDAGTAYLTSMTLDNYEKSGLKLACQARYSTLA